jgi:hypothetical protein
VISSLLQQDPPTMNPPSAGSSATLDNPRTAAVAQAARSTLVTHLTIAAPAERVWSSLQFYEELDVPPPLLLRLFLPRPIAVPAGATDLGRETTLRYAGGHYARRVVRLEPSRSYEFEVTEQRLDKDRGVMLLGGAYALRNLGADQTDLSITTVYASGLRPRWLFQSVETAICRQLQRHLLAAIAKRATQN